MKYQTNFIDEFWVRSYILLMMDGKVALKVAYTSY